MGDFMTSMDMGQRKKLEAKRGGEGTAREKEEEEEEKRMANA